MFNTDVPMPEGKYEFCLSPSSVMNYVYYVVACRRVLQRCIIKVVSYISVVTFRSL